MTDPELIAALRSGASPEAFAETVRRHLPLVLSAARRQLTVPDAAEDVAQQVFALLAQKMSSLAPNVVLAGWLYHTTCHLASEHNRSEGRRRHREQNAMAMTDSPHLPAEVEDHWRQLRPVLDDAMTKLSEPDRDAVLLRYFEGRSLDEVGRSLGVTADAAQKRVSRALDRLRETLVQSHPWVTPGTLSTAIAAGVIEATPTEIQAAAIAHSAREAAAVHAIAASTATSLSTTPAGTSLITMASTQSIVTGALTAALLGVVAWQHFQISALREERNQLVQSAEATTSATTATSTPTPTPPAPGVDPELLRLRGEVARLRGLSNEVGRLNRELTSLRATRPPAERPVETDKEELKRVGILKMNYMKSWALAAFQFSEAHGGVLPKNFEDIASQVPQDAQFAELKPEQFEFTFHGRIDSLGDPGRYFIAREKDAFAMRTARGYARTYVFADGHSEIHTTPDGNFEKWETEHTPPVQGP